MVLYQGACARKRRYYLIQKTIKNNSYQGHVQEDITHKEIYGQDDIISYRKLEILIYNSFHGHVQKDIISYRNLLFV